MSKLNIGTSDTGKAFTLPVDLVTQTSAILARKGSGKSHTAAVFAEELLDAGQQAVIIDPTGAHYGLRSSRDGKSTGYPILVAGGDHGDIPLEEGAGETLARAVVEHRFSAILDLSLLRKGAANRFLGMFLEALYRLNREALHLIGDEADLYAPQRPFGDEARTLGAMEDIVRRGRIRGIGCTLITQRPAVINKNVLTQCEVLVAMRLVHPKDIAAVMEWVQVHADPAQAKRMLESLPSLPVGTAWFWSPGWGDLFERVKVRERKTFDSGATPKAGQKAEKPKVLAAVDVQRLGAEIASAAEKAKANDPAALKRRVAELDAQVRKLQQEVVERPEVAGFTAADVAQAEARGEAAMAEKIRVEVANAKAGMQLLGQVGAIVNDAGDKVNNALQRLLCAQPMPSGSIPAPRPANMLNTRATPAPAVRKAVATGSGPSTVTGGEKAILSACVQHGGCSREQLTVLTGYKRSSRDTYIQRLSSKGLVTTSGDIVATAEGIEALGGDYEPLPTGQALQTYWLDRLGGGERELLRLVIGAYPQPITRDALSASSDYKRSSRDTYLQRLSSRRLIEDAGRGAVVASKVLF